MAYDRRRNSQKYCEPTFESKIGTVIGATDCRKHDAEELVPCWIIADQFGAVCNSRARRAGFHGKISPVSLNLSNRGKPASKEK